MRRLTVLIFLICLASGAWQFSEEIALTKIDKVNDLAVNDNGEIWILSLSAVSRIDTKSGNLLLPKQVQNTTALTVLGESVYLVDNYGRLSIYATGGDENAVATGLQFNNPTQMAALSINGSPGLIVREPSRLVFATPFEMFSSLTTNAERFALIPRADYTERNTPLFTLNGNRIFTWTGGRFMNAANYTSKLIYSASNSILDFCADKKGNLYVLFTDSITVIDHDGEYKGKIGVGHVSFGSRILTNPKTNDLVLFDQLARSLQIISETGRDAEELIVLNKNTPNPVDNYTEISFTLSEPLTLTITIYNLIGEPVKLIARDRYLNGTHRVVWNADDAQGNLVPNGVYFYRLESKKGVAIRQLIVLR
jgi:hypothetical protein